MVYTISKDDVLKEDKGRVWKQWILGIIAYLPFLTQSLQLKFLDIVPPKINSNGVSWHTTALILGALFSSPVLCWAADRHGRKAVVLVVTCIQMISFIIVFSNLDVSKSIATSVLLGISTGGIFTVLPIYVREVCNDRRRSVSLSLMAFMIALGHLVVEMLRDWLWRPITGYLMMAVLVLQFLIMFCLVESPSYFVMKNNIQLAKENYAKLKCMKPDSLAVTNHIVLLIDESERAKAGGKINPIRMLKTQTWRQAVKLGIVLQTCYIIGGFLVFLEHNKVMDTVGITDDTYVFNLTVPFLLVVGSLVSVVSIFLVEQKYILTVSFATMALALGVLGVFMQADMELTSIPWLPTTAFMVTVLGYGIGRYIPYFMMTELLNMEIRATVIGALFSYSQLIYLTHIHTIEHIEDYVGSYIMCYLFAGVNMFGAVHALFTVPDIRMKSVREIEKRLRIIPPWKI